MNDIPDDLIVNWDQTGIQLAPTGDWTMHRSGAKIIPIGNSDDKCQITAVLSASMDGKYLVPQLIFEGKTTRCHPKVTFPITDGSIKTLTKVCRCTVLDFVL